MSDYGLLLLLVLIVLASFGLARMLLRLAELRQQCGLATREREEVIDFLNHFCRQLADVTDMGDTLQLVSRYLCDVLRAESLAIFTLETDAAAGAPKRLRGSAVTGSFPTFQKSSDLVMSKAKHRLEHLRHEYIAVGEGIIGRAAQENRSILISDTAGDANPDEIPRRVYTLMAVPVQVDGRFVGVACAVNCREEGRRFDEQDLRLFENLSYQAALASKLVAIYAERGKHERLQRELQVGQEIQRSLLPAMVPQWGEYRFAAFAQPALEVGGDYYDFVPIDADRLMVVMADASGKGVPACMLMAACRSFVHCLADRYAGLPQFLQELNSRLYRSTDRAHFLTMAVAVLDRRSHVLEYGNAGHTPLLVRGPDGVTRSLKPEGSALGMLPDDLCPRFETLSLDVPAGTRLLLFTDGITEALNAADAEFGLDRLRQVWEKGSAAPQGLADLVVAAVRQFCGATPQYDDQTLVVITRE